MPGSSFFTEIVDLFFPGEPLVDERLLQRCYLDDEPVQSSFWLDDHAKKLIHRVKYGGDFFLLRRLVSLGSAPVEPDFVMVPVPLHPRRLWQRGFNQSELIAERLNGPIAYDVLKKGESTRPQSRLSQRERLENLKHSFFLDKRFAVPERCLLIDDVVTTGATLNTCAKVLRKGGAKEIRAYTLFRAIRVK